MEKNLCPAPVQEWSNPGAMPKAVNPAVIPDTFLMKFLLLLFMIFLGLQVRKRGYRLRKR
jgi:hypothetical protein